MVDTGASGVAINESTARRLGIHVRQHEFRHIANTANGPTKFAAVMIDEVRVGRVVVYDVQAAVLRDNALSSTLLGMSFLSKLRKFEVDHGTLILTQ